MAKTPKRATKDAARRMIVHAWSKNDTAVANDEKSMPGGFVNPSSATTKWPCAAQMLTVEFWIAYLRFVCLRRSLPDQAVMN